MRRLVIIVSSLIIVVSMFASVGVNTFAADDVELFVFYPNNDNTAYTLAECDSSATGDVVIPDSYNGKPVTEIGLGAFEDCTEIATVSIPAGIKDISSDYSSVFSPCLHLVNIYVDENNTEFCSVDGVLYSKSMDKLYSYPAGKLDPLFAVPESVSVIKCEAFKGSEVQDVELPEGLFTIESEAFCDCEYLYAINIPDSLTEISGDCFVNTAISEFVVSEENSYFTSEDGVLFDKEKTRLIKYPAADSAKKYVVPSTVSVMDAYAFDCCTSLKEIVVPDTITEFDDGLFKGCTALSKINIPDDIIDIGYDVFAGCDSLEEITVPAELEYEYQNPFHNITGLKKVFFEQGRDVISVSFNGCSNLESVVIPGGVESISQGAFAGCDKLKYIELPGSIKYIDKDAFKGCENLRYVFCSDSSFDVKKLTLSTNNDVVLEADWVVGTTIASVEKSIVAFICVLVVAFALVIVFILKKKKILILVAGVVVIATVVSAIGLVVSKTDAQKDNLDLARENYSKTFAFRDTKVTWDSNETENADVLEATVVVEHDGMVIAEFLEEFSADAKDIPVKVDCPRYLGNGPITYNYLWVNVDDKVYNMYLPDKEITAEFEGYKDVVAYVVDYTGHHYIAYNGGYDLSVITNTDRVIHEEHIENKADVITGLYRGEGSVLIVRGDETEEDYEEHDDLPFSDMCKKSILSVQATSTLSPQGDKTYGVENLFDNDNATVWSEGVAGAGIGEKITVKIDPAISECAYYLAAGHQGSEDLHKKNNTVKKFRVTSSAGIDEVIEVVNTDELRSGQSFGVGEGSEWFTIEILEVEKGTKYDDTCISEICFDFS